MLEAFFLVYTEATEVFHRGERDFTTDYLKVYSLILRCGYLRALCG
jgi:hypothetical protein